MIKHADFALAATRTAHELVRNGEPLEVRIAYLLPSGQFLLAMAVGFGGLTDSQKTMVQDTVRQKTMLAVKPIACVSMMEAWCVDKEPDEPLPDCEPSEHPGRYEVVCFVYEGLDEGTSMAVAPLDHHREFDVDDVMRQLDRNVPVAGGNLSGGWL